MHCQGPLPGDTQTPSVHTSNSTTWDRGTHEEQSGQLLVQLKRQHCGSHIPGHVFCLGRASFPLKPPSHSTVSVLLQKGVCSEVEKPVHPKSEKNIPAAAPSKKSPLSVCLPFSYQYGPLPMGLCQYLLSSPPSITWCVTSHCGTY